MLPGLRQPLRLLIFAHCYRAPESEIWIIMTPVRLPRSRCAFARANRPHSDCAGLRSINDLAHMNVAAQANWSVTHVPGLQREPRTRLNNRRA